MLYEDRLYGFAVAAMGCVCWGEPGAAEQAVDVAEAMEAQFTARLKSRRDAAEQAAKKAREDAARADAKCDWAGCCEPSTVLRVGLGGTPSMVCLAHEAEGDAMGYWLPKGSVQP